MARVKTARITRKKHKKVLKQAKGYFGAKHYRFRNANQAVLKSLSYAYVGRKDKKSDFRKLWIARINAASRVNGLTYSKLIAGLKKANVEINRKMLSELAIFAPEEFTKLVKLAKDALEGKAPKKEAKEVEAKVEKTVSEKTDYSKLTVAELKDLCAKKNIDVTGMKKADLVAALEK